MALIPFRIHLEDDSDEYNHTIVIADVFIGVHHFQISSINGELIVRSANPQEINILVIPDSSNTIRVSAR